MRITVIGNSTIDLLVRPVDHDVFGKGSVPAEEIRMCCGGDALNEAVMLARMGHEVQLVSKTGRDDAGERILSFLKENNVAADHMIIDEHAETSVNIVLVDEKGQRAFITNPSGSQRCLAKEDVLLVLDQAGEIVSFASIFVSSAMSIEDMTEVFRKIKEKNRILCADMTKAKHQETLQDLAGLLPYADYIFPNAQEAALLTGIDDPEVNAKKFIEAGVKHAVIKLGEEGCLLCTEEKMMHVPAYHTDHCTDTTGAGDSFAAGFIHALASGMTLEQCALFANAAASCNVEHTGANTGIVSLKEPVRRYNELCRRVK